MQRGQNERYSYVIIDVDDTIQFQCEWNSVYLSSQLNIFKSIL